MNHRQWVGICAALVFAAAGRAQGAMMFSVEERPSELPIVADFGGLSGSGPYIGSIHRERGASMSSIFTGQVVGVGTGTTGSDTWDYDVLTTETGTAPLTLSPSPMDGGDHNNLAVFDLGPPFGVVIGGVTNSPTSGGLAGAFSVLFDSGQTELGLDVLGFDTPGSELHAHFLGGAGELLGTTDYTSTSSGNATLTFAATGGVFYGITLTNDDPFGVSYDNLRYAVPAPAPLALIAMLLPGLRVLRRAHRRQG